MIVPKVSADVRTAVLYAVLEGQTDRARSLIKDMSPAGRYHFMAVLAQITGLLRTCPSLSDGHVCAYPLGHAGRHGDPYAGASGVNWDEA